MRFTICAFLLCLLIAVAARAADNSPTTRPSPEDENRALRSQIETQRDQIQKLSKELREKESELAQLRLKQRLSVLPQLPPAQPFSLVPSAPAMPRGAVPQQFNGS